MKPEIFKELENTTVLVVDDNLDFAETLKEQLEVIGMKVLGVACNGTQALRMTEELDPALVILDIMMEPDMDGIEVAMRMNAVEPRPIIFLSAFSEPAFIERASVAGVFTYLVKPITIEKMVPSIVLTLDRFREMISLKATVDDMRETLSNRKLIEQATRLMMEKKGMSESEAYASILKKSQDENKPMADIAQAIVMVDDLF